MDPTGNTATSLAILRQGLQVGAGVLITRGVVDEATASLMIGATTSVVTLFWALFSRRQLARAPAVK
jgi:hypothetical protein